MRASSSPAAPKTLRLGRFAAHRSILALPAVQWSMAMAAGIIASEWVPWGVATWTIVLAGAAIVAMGGSEKFFSAPSTAACVVAAMAIWSIAHTGPGVDSQIVHLAGNQWQPVVLRAEVVASAQLRPDTLASLRAPDGQPRYQSVIELVVREVRSGSRWTESSGLLRTVVGGDVTDLLRGDEVIAYGHLQRIGGPTNPGAADMREIFAARGIYVHLRIDSPEQLRLERRGRWGPRRIISWLGVHGDRALQKYVGPEAGPLAAALVLGRRQAVDPETRNRLLETGTIHLLSVSGLHLGMVALAVTWLVLLSGWSHGWQVIIVLSVCVFYAALTGAQPPVLRASMLVGALLIGTWAGKHPHPFNSLAIAAIVLMAVNPNNLWQTGTQLSFLAVAILVIVGGRAMEIRTEHAPIAELIRSTRPRWMNRCVSWVGRVKQSAVVSFWVWIVTAPLVWQAYNILSPISVLANLLMAIPLMVALLSGVVTSAVALVAGPVAAPAGWLCRGCIEVMRWIIDGVAVVPYGHLWFPAPPVWWVIVFYVLLVLAVVTPDAWRPGRVGRRSLVLGWITVWFVVAFALATAPSRDRPADRLTLTFIDVGHGTSVLIELPDARGTWLYDAGRLGDPVWSASPIQDVMWSRGIWRLDGIIISHADSDHYNAIPDLLDRFHIAKIVATPGLLEDDQRGLDALRLAIDRAGTPVRVVWDGHQIGSPIAEGGAGSGWAEVLHPAKDGPYASSDNARSLVMIIEHAGTTVALPGDLEMPGTERLIRHPRPAPGGVLMAPHHGSLKQDARPVLDWARPSVVVVSGGRRADRVEVRRMWAQKGADVYVTSAVGAVRMDVDAGGRTSVRHWSLDHWAQTK